MSPALYPVHNQNDLLSEVPGFHDSKQLERRYLLPTNTVIHLVHASLLPRNEVIALSSDITVEPAFAPRPCPIKQPISLRKLLQDLVARPNGAGEASTLPSPSPAFRARSIAMHASVEIPYHPRPASTCWSCAPIVVFQQPCNLIYHPWTIIQTYSLFQGASHPARHVSSTCVSTDLPVQAIRIPPCTT